MANTHPLHDIAREHGITAVFLFGSHARDAARPTSDIDVAILGNAPLGFTERGAVIDAIARHLNVSEDMVDLVDLWSASPLLQHEIATNGKALYGDAFVVLRFKVLAWKRYQDTAKFRRAREQALQSYVQRIDSQKT